MNKAMNIGVCYYPEHWPQNNWADDAARMRELGISIVRVGEFAWQQLEPADGELQFDWLHQALDTLHQAGLQTVLGTPTATPPKWLVDKYPDMLAVDHNGQARRFGSRRHYCFSCDAYVQECKRIVELVACEFGRHKSLLAWQTDNEYGCHDTAISYSRHAAHAFRGWCAETYQTIEALNQAWGNAFWSMNYRSFNEIDLPLQTVTEAHPSHQLAFWQFSSDQVKRFNKAQVEVIRKHSPGIPVSHNFMGNFVQFDHRRVAADLDIATWDSYPLGFLDRDSQDTQAQEIWMRTGHPDTAAFHHDLYRGLCNGRWWVMEQQPGPVNWAPHNPSPLPGMARLWGLEAFAHGAETVSYFRWRQAPFAQEMMHTGLLLNNGEEDWAAGEVKQLSADIAKLLPALANPGTDVTDPDQKQNFHPTEVAIVFDYDSDCALRIQRPGGGGGLHAPVGGRFDPLEWTQQAYSAIRRLGLSIDVVGQDADLSGYKFVVVACAAITSSRLVASLEKTKATVLILPRNGSRSKYGTLPENLPPGPLQALMPLQVVRSESLPSNWQQQVILENLTAASNNPPSSIGFVASSGSNHHVVTCCDWREQIRSSITPSGTFSDGWGFYYQYRNYHYLNAWLDPEGLQAIMKSLLDETGITTVPCPEGFRLRRHRNLIFAINYGPHSVDLLALNNLPDDEKSAIRRNLLLGKTTVQPAAAAVWSS